MQVGLGVIAAFDDFGLQERDEGCVEIIFMSEYCTRRFTRSG